MIERLIRSLQALAAPAEVQVARYPAFVEAPGEPALEFADALLLASDCPQVRLDHEERDRLFALDRLLDGMTGARRAEMWTERALRAAPEWGEVRRRAREALRCLGHPLEPSPRTGVGRVEPQ